MNTQFLKRVGAICTSAVMSLGALAVSGTSVPMQANAADGDNYAKLLQYSLYLYDANMCGDMSGCGIEWRGNCHMQDDVVGGFHDAGDHVMFGQPQGYAASTLGWAYYEFKDAFEETGQSEHLKFITDRFCKFFREATVLSGDNVQKVLIEKGEGGPDHNYWGAPEQQGSRGRMLWTTGGAANITAEYAAALAANYVNFGNPDDLKYAKALYNFSKRDPGYYSCDFYDGHWTGSDDELNWAAGWLYLATKDDTYKNDLSKAGQSYSVHSWESVQLGAGILKGEITNDWGSTGFLGSLKGDGYCFAAESWKWGSARYNTTGQFCQLVAAKYQKGDAAWAKGQMQYITGDKPFANGQSHCLVVGFKDNSSKNPHHRAASPGANASENNDGIPNQYLLVGALCGGPMDANGTYYDKRSDYTGNEVALDYNAGFVGAAAGLYHFYKTGSIATSIPGVTKIYNGKVDTPQPGTTTTAPKDDPLPNVTTTKQNPNPGPGGTRDADVTKISNKEYKINVAGAEKLTVTMKTNSNDTETNGGIFYNSDGEKRWSATPQNGIITVEFEIPSGVSEISFQVWWPETATMESAVLSGGGSVVQPTTTTQTTTTTTSTSTSTFTTTTTTSTSSSSTTTTTTTTTTTAKPEPRVTMRGDANLDNLVDVGDCVMILRFVSGDSSANVKDQGKLNGDVNGSGNLDDGDADRILKYIARLIPQL